jgi:hypothetical protein
LPRIVHLDTLIADLERETKQSREDNKSLRTDTVELRKNSDYVREQLANYEDVIDKKINTDIMKRIESLNNAVSEFEKEVWTMKNSSETEFHNQNEKITLLISSKEEHSSMFEMLSSSIKTIETRLTSGDQKQKAIAESLLITSEGQFNEMKHQFDGKIAELITITNEHGGILEQYDDRMTEMVEQSRRFQQDLSYTNREVEELKKQNGEDRELVVMRFRETKDTMESFFQRLETLQSTQSQESSRVEIIAKQTESQERLASQLEDKIMKMERFGEEQNSLILAVERTAHAKVEEMESELQAYVNNSQQDLRNIRTTVDCDRAGLWGGLVELFSAFRGYTVVIKSEGAVRVHQADVLGVYRMMDSYNDRPVYKQDGGENYIYYSAASNTWFVGTVVGHQYGWLRNGSEEATSRRWIPDLRTGWEYRPLVRSAASIGHNTWLSDDGTLRIESLKEVDKLKQAIHEMKSERLSVQ